MNTRTGLAPRTLPVHLMLEMTDVVGITFSLNTKLTSAANMADVLAIDICK